MKKILNDNIFKMICTELNEIILIQNNHNLKINIYFENKWDNRKSILHIKSKNLPHLFGIQYLQLVYQGKYKDDYNSFSSFFKDSSFGRIIWTSIKKKILTNFKNINRNGKFKNVNEFIEIIENKIIGFYLFILCFKKLNNLKLNNMHFLNIFDIDGNSFYLNFNYLIGSDYLNLLKDNNRFVILCERTCNDNYVYRTCIPKSMRCYRSNKLKKISLHKVKLYNVYFTN